MIQTPLSRGNIIGNTDNLAIVLRHQIDIWILGCTFKKLNNSLLGMIWKVQQMILLAYLIKFKKCNWRAKGSKN